MIRVGISGWRYDPWRGVFYPQGLPQRRELEFCGARFPTVEINGSFYSLQRPEYYAQWLGPFLWQLPPMFRFDAARLEPFLELLPRTTGEALSLARRRDARLHGRSRLAIDAERPLRHALEVRHPSFMNEAFVGLLRRHRIGLVVADTAGKWPKMFHVTSDFVYLRLHGDVKLYTSGYSERALASWARRIRAWDRDGLDVYVYFDNDAKVKAPFDALNLMHRLGLPRRARGSSQRREPRVGLPETILNS